MSLFFFRWFQNFPFSEKNVKKQKMEKQRREEKESGIPENRTGKIGSSNLDFSNFNLKNEKF